MRFIALTSCATSEDKLLVAELVACNRNLMQLLHTKSRRYRKFYQRRHAVSTNEHIRRINKEYFHD